MAKKAKVKTVQQAVPTIYAYVTPEIRRHDGWTKIGYTEQAPEKRIKQQTKTADVIFELKWHMNAIYEDGGSFKDQQFHAYLQKHDVERLDNTEWFHILPEPARQELIDFRRRITSHCMKKANTFGMQSQGLERRSHHTTSARGLMQGTSS